MRSDEATDRLLEEILVDAYGEDEQLWAFHWAGPGPHGSGDFVGADQQLNSLLIDDLRCLLGYGLCLGASSASTRKQPSSPLCAG